MKAVILAAGIGSRLRPMTETKPKSMINVAGKPILLHQIDAYKNAGVKEIAVVIGYQGEIIKSALAHEKDINITFYENEIFEDTNNMYSLWLAKNFINSEAFYLSNADVVFDPSILNLSQDSESCIFVDKSIYNDESMKVSLNKDGVINHISKIVSKQDSYAASIDVYKFSPEHSGKIFSHIEDVIINQKKLKDWTEVALNDLFEAGEVNPYAVDIECRKWVEIDNYDDLAMADKKFSDFDFSLNKYKNFIFDLDGTIFIGDKPIVSAIEQVKNIMNLNKNVFFMTNNSSKSKTEYVKKLGSMDLNIKEEQIISSVDNILSFLQQNKVIDVNVVGTKSLIDTLEKEGLNTKSNNPEYVVIGYDTELTYEKLVNACKFINQGVDFIATHIDMYCPTVNGAIPDCGAITNMIEITTGKKVKQVFGKPSVSMFNSVDLDMNETVIIGDRLHTDGVLAKNSKADYILVLSGETNRADVEDNTEISIKLCLKNFGCLYN